MKQFFIFTLVFIFLVLIPVKTIAGELSDRLSSYPQWNNKLSLNQGQRDLMYPDWMEGTWKVTSILVNQVAPLTPEVITPGFTKNQRYLNQPITFKVRFQRKSDLFSNIFSLSSVVSNKPYIIADRAFNGLNIAEAYLGKDNILSVKVDPSNPNRQITFLSPNSQLISIVTGRSQEIPNPQEFVTTEITQQFFNRSSSIYLNEVETTTKYHLISSNKIEVNQVTAIYLSPEDPDYFKAINRPVALYQYQLTLDLLSKSIQNN